MACLILCVNWYFFHFFFKGTVSILQKTAQSFSNCNFTVLKLYPNGSLSIEYCIDLSGIFVFFLQELYESSAKDCTKALELHPHYVKALLRRAECYEKTDKLEQALEDYQQLLTIDPSIGQAREACMVSHKIPLCKKPLSTR